MRLLIALFVPVLAGAAIWPDNIGAWHRVSAQPAGVTQQQALWDEFGFQESEAARYGSDGKSFTATAYRFIDPTGAMAAFEWQRPAAAKPSPLGRMAAETANGLLIQHGNYLLSFEGYKPTSAETGNLVQILPKLDQSPLPTLIDYLPADNLIRNSERYVTGPTALETFFPGVPSATAAFRMGAEGAVGTFHEPGGDLKLAVFNYPTPHIARERLEEFGKIPGAMAKRSGPLVAVILNPANADSAEKLLSRVRYQAEITMSERVPTRKDNIGDLIINAFILIGILLCFSVVAGVAFGGFRTLRQRFFKGAQDEAMIVLHLEDH
jgi:hypothetical protein